MLTVEHNQDLQTVEIFCDDDGLDFLIYKLQLLQKTGGHEHFKTPAWAGDELGQAAHGEGNEIINHLVVVLRRDS